MLRRMLVCLHSDTPSDFWSAASNSKAAMFHKKPMRLKWLMIMSPSVQRSRVRKSRRSIQLREYNESMIRTVKVGTDEFATMDDYEHELDINDSTALLTLSFGTMRTSLSSKMFQMLCGHQLFGKAATPPEQWVDQLADEIEIQTIAFNGCSPEKGGVFG